MYHSANWIEPCSIKIIGEEGIITYDNSCKSGEIVVLDRDTCSLILKGLKDIFIDKKYPIIISKTKAKDMVCGEYPFFEVTMYYKKKKKHKFLYVATRSERYIFHYSKQFTEIWNIIQKLAKECYAREKARRREESRRARELEQQRDSSVNPTSR
ncbi:MAG: hypothetical protein U0M50_07495 [Paramuribaculum sp.]